MFKFVTDLGADIPKKFFNNQTTVKIPLSVLIDGEEEFIDIYESDKILSFYQRIKSGAKAVSHAVSKAECIAVMEPVLQEGYDVLAVSCSQFISATGQQLKLATDELAEKYPARKALYVSTSSASVGEGMIIRIAQSPNVSIEEAQKIIADCSGRTSVYICLKDKSLFVEGGRLGNTKIEEEENYTTIYLPIDGLYKVYGKSPSRRQVYEDIVDFVKRAMPLVGNEVFIGHGSNIAHASELVNILQEKLNVKGYAVFSNAVSGAHTGDDFFQIGFTSVNKLQYT